MEKFEINSSPFSNLHEKLVQEYKDGIEELVSKEATFVMQYVLKHIISCMEKIGAPIKEHTIKMNKALQENDREPLTEKGMAAYMAALTYTASLHIAHNYRGAMELVLEDIDHVIKKVTTQDKAANDSK